jgi:hypothetical protein
MVAILIDELADVALLYRMRRECLTGLAGLGTFGNSEVCKVIGDMVDDSDLP